MAQYFAWVFFVVGVINLVATTMRYVRKEQATFFEWPQGTFSTLVFCIFDPLCFYLWWLWK